MGAAARPFSLLLLLLMTGCTASLLEPAPVIMGTAAREAVAGISREAEQDFEHRKICKLLDQAQLLYDHRQYAQCARLCVEIIEIDPVNAEAHRLLAASRGNMHIQRVVEAYELRWGSECRERAIAGLEPLRGRSRQHESGGRPDPVDEKVNTMLDRARELYVGGRREECERVATAILELDPLNAGAGWYLFSARCYDKAMLAVGWTMFSLVEQ